MDGWATLNNLKHQCESLKPGTEYVIKITQKELDEQLKKAISGAGCNVKLEKKNWKTVVVIVKKQEENDDLDVDNLLWSIEASANKDEEQYHKQVEEKEKQMKEKEKQMKEKEKEMKSEKIEVKFTSSFKIVSIESNNKNININKIILNLNTMINALKWIRKYNFISVTKKEYNQRIYELNILEEFYRSYKKVNSKNRKEILSKIKQIKEILEQWVK